VLRWTQYYGITIGVLSQTVCSDEVNVQKMKVGYMKKCVGSKNGKCLDIT
jgi:hypothetical protein